MHSKNTYLGIIGVFFLIVGLLAWAIRLDLTAFSIVPLVLGGLSLLAYAGTNINFLSQALTGRTAVAGSNMIVSVIIFGAIIVFLQILLARHSQRLDYTESKKFSLATQTLNLLKGQEISGLEDPLKILYLENMRDPGGNVRAKDLLELYDHFSDNLDYEIIDPERNPEKVQELAPVTLGAAYIMKGLQHEKISPVDENNLTNGLLKILKGGSRAVYFTTGHDEHSIESEEPSGMKGMKQILTEEGYEPKELQLYTMNELPEDALALIISGPKKPFLETEIPTLKTYLDKGGKVLFMIDPETNSGLEPFLAETYGVSLGDNWVLEQNPLVQLMGGKPYVPLIAEVGSHPIMNAFKNGVPAISFPLVRSIQLNPDMPEGVEGTEIIKTSSQSWAETNIQGLRADGTAAFDEGEDVMGPISIAVALSKKVDAAEGQPEDASETAEDNVETLDASPEARIVVFGDSDFATNSRYSNSYDLFVNTINWLTNQEDMISIRPKDDAGSPVIIDRFQGNIVFYSSLIILPGLVAAFGAAIVMMRKLKG